jgi:hypothetical protein
MIAASYPWKKHWPIALLLALPVLVYWFLIFGGRALYWGLPLYQFYPWHTLVVEAVRAGYLPLWTDLLGNGAPLLANHQSALFYPFNLIYFVAPVERAMGYSVVLHLILAGLFAYAWGCSVGLSRFGATVTGLSFMLSGFFVSRTQFITIVNSAAWLPLLFLLGERLSRRQAWLDAVWLGVVLALQFLAGHAQLWFYSLCAVVTYVLVRVWSLHRAAPSADALAQPGIWSRRGRIFALLAGALILALSLSAVQLLPTAELALHSQRAGGLDPEDAMTYSFWPWRLLTLVVPNLFGSPASGDYWGYATYWEDAGYIGVLPLLLALTAVWGWARRKFPLLMDRRSGHSDRPNPDNRPASAPLQDFLVPFLSLVSVVALILAMGRNTPVYPLIFNYVPGFGAFRAPARWLLFYTFGVSTLAGLGADRFRLSYRAQYVARLTGAGAAAMLVVSLVMQASSQRANLTIEPTFAPAIASFALWLGLAAILLLLCPIRARSQPVEGKADGPAADGTDPRIAHSPLTSTAWRGLVIGLVTIDLALFAAPLTPSIDPALYQGLTPADRWLQARGDDSRLFATYDYDYDTKFNTYLDFSDWGSPDLAHWLSFRETLVPNLNLFAHTSSVNNDEPLVVGRWRALMEALRTADWPARQRLLRIMDVGYVLANHPAPELSRVADVAGLYRLSGSLPRTWMVSKAREIGDPDQALSELLSASFDPAAEVLLESVPNRPGRPGNLDAEAQAALADSPLQVESPQTSYPAVDISLHEAWNSRTIDLVAPQPGYLILAYTYYPGWRATVDDQPAEILRANYAFMALSLGPGEHQVRLRYQPVSFLLGAVVSSLALFTLVGLAVLAFRSSKSASSAQG